MTTTGRQATDPQNVKEIDSVKESISDIINQLQDIDPARLSFSPFLDLDTQISLAPVSDSPESSVEELHSPSHSVTGSQQSLEPQPAADKQGGPGCPQQPSESLAKESRPDEAEEEGTPDRTLSSSVDAARALEDAAENCISTPHPASERDIPNGMDPPRWSPESNNLNSTVGEGHPLISAPPDSVELTLWSSQDQGETCDAPPEASAGGGQCCCCKCCQNGRIPALCSVLASLLCTVGILYALYFYVPVQAPNCPDMVSRITFTLCCSVVATVPVLLALLTSAFCQFCTGSLNPVEPFPRRRAAQQLFVTASLEQLLLYVLNLVVLATFLPQEQLRVVPMLIAIFIIGRFAYWICLHVCSSWRGFGSGMTVFPLLAMTAFNLYCMYDLGLRQLLFGSDDALYNQTTPPSWPTEMSHGPSGKSDNALPTDILDAQ